MPYSDDTICSAWATEAELIAHCTSLEPVLSEIPAGTIDAALLSASDTLYTLSGRIFTGLCMTTITPTYESTCYRYVSGVNRIDLGVWPIHAIVSVTVNGVEVDPVTYTLEGFKYLQFTGPIPTGFVATVQYGMVPPPAGKRACLALACELLAAFLDDENSLPDGVSSTIGRQGITQDLIDPEDLLQNGRTGIYDVDRFLMTYNPKKLPSPTFLIGPTTPANRMDSGAGAYVESGGLG